MRCFADAFACNREGADHGDEDLDGGTECDLPEFCAIGADRKRREVIHGGGREVDEEGEEEDLEDEAGMPAIGSGRIRDASDEALDTRLRRDRNVFEDPLHEAREEKDDDEAGDHTERDRNRDRGEEHGAVAEDAYSEGQCDEEGHEDAGEAAHFLYEFRSGHFNGLAGEARSVKECVSIEASGRRQERADEAADQE